MVKCTDCKHVLRFVEGMSCGLLHAPMSADPETGRISYALGAYNTIPTEVSCTYAREDHRKFWSRELKTDNCGVIARFFERA